MSSLPLDLSRVSPEKRKGEREREREREGGEISREEIKQMSTITLQ